MRLKKANRLVAVTLAILLVISVGGCSKQKNVADKLRILVDVNVVKSIFYEGNRENAAKEFAAALSYWSGLREEELAIELLPTEETERAVRIKALRTEIMSGGGPDVYFISNNLPGFRQEAREEMAEDFYIMEDSEQRLFLDMQKSIHDGMFLPLTPYLSTARYFDRSLLQSTVAEACEYENELVVLPISFTFPVAVYLEKDVSVQNMPTMWQEGADNKQEAVRLAYGNAAWQRFPDLFDVLSDTSGETLNFSQEFLLQTVKEALSLNTVELTETRNSMSENDFDIWELNYRDTPQNGFLSEYSLDRNNISCWNTGYFEPSVDPAAGKQMIFPVRNTKGGVTAAITGYACINRNTACPEKAFRALDTLFYHQMQNCRGESQSESEIPDMRSQTFLYFGFYGVPARNDLMRNIEFSFVQNYASQFLGVTDSEVFSEYTALRSEVTHARFYGTLDQELQTMYEACLEAESDEEIEKIVSKAYDTMLMILAES